MIDQMECQIRCQEYLALFLAIIDMKFWVSCLTGLTLISSSPPAFLYHLDDPSYFLFLKERKCPLISWGSFWFGVRTWKLSILLGALLRNKLIRSPRELKKRVEKVRKSDHSWAQFKQICKGEAVKAAEEMLRNMFMIVTEENYNSYPGKMVVGTEKYC